MAWRRYLLSGLALLAVQAHAAHPDPVVRTHQDWLAAQASPAGTPLDALTPHGKRRFIAALGWSERGLRGLPTAALVRELDDAALLRVLTFLDSADLYPLLRRQLVGAPLRLPAPSGAVERALAALEQADADDMNEAFAQSTGASGAPRLTRTYASLFSARIDGAALAWQATADLPLLFDAAAQASLREPAGPASIHLRRVHREMAARGIDTRRTFDRTLFDAMLAERAFDEARRFAAGRAHMQDYPVPQVVDGRGDVTTARSVYAIDTAGAVLTRQALPAPRRQLVMVVGAGCGFSQAALDDIVRDAPLLARLREANLITVTPPRAPVAWQFMAHWNTVHEELPIVAPADAGEWRAVDVTGVPAFFLLQDGRPVGQPVTGWPREGNKAALLDLLARGRAPASMEE